MDGILLDTCALVWLATGDRKLSRGARQRIRTSPAVYVSPVSAWEIARKHKKGDLILPIEPQTLFDEAVAKYGVLLLPLDVRTMFKASELPEIHKDPADRFIIASALFYDLAVATGDHRFPAYGVKTFC